MQVMDGQSVDPSEDLGFAEDFFWNNIPVDNWTIHY